MPGTNVDKTNNNITSVIEFVMLNNTNPLTNGLTLIILQLKIKLKRVVQHIFSLIFSFFSIFHEVTAIIRIKFS